MVQGHDCTCEELATFLKACGTSVQREQHIPAWDRQVLDGNGAPAFEVRRDERGHIVAGDDGLPIRDPVMDRAIMDLCFNDREGRRTHADVTIGAVTTANLERRQVRNQTDGSKAAELASRKRARYNPAANPHEGFVPFAIESRGRLGDDALALMRSMAPTDPRDRSRLIARGLQGISVRVQTRLAELLLSAERAYQAR